MRNLPNDLGQRPGDNEYFDYPDPACGCDDCGATFMDDRDECSECGGTSFTPL